MIAPLHRWLHALSLRPLSTLRAFGRLPWYFFTYRQFKRSTGTQDDWHLALTHPCLSDHADAGGTASGHYFHQDLFVAQCIFERRPKRHCDVGSRVDGFVAHVASFREIECFDLRPVAGSARNIVFRQGDLLNSSSLPKHGCDSVSALHVIEHVGLGRYGDRVLADGWESALRNLADMLAPDGLLYLSVPVGRQRIEFNAHRVFSPITIVNLGHDLNLKLERFAWIDDKGEFHAPMAEPAMIPNKVNFLEYGCGIFELRRML